MNVLISPDLKTTFGAIYAGTIKHILPLFHIIDHFRFVLN